MTFNEIITTCSTIAEKYGVQLVDKSDNPVNDWATLRIEYYKKGRWIGGASYCNAAKHPEYFTPSDLKRIEAQIKYLSRKYA